MGLVEFGLLGIVAVLTYTVIIEVIKTYKEVKLAKINSDIFKDEKK